MQQTRRILSSYFASLQTNGRGVDLALNSLADDKLTATVRCIAPHGHLLEIGKYDILKQTGLSMRPMHYNISFQGVDLDNLFLSPKLDAVRTSLPDLPGIATWQPDDLLT